MTAAELPSTFFERRHAATDRLVFVSVPARRLFAVAGMGPPRSPLFRLARETLRAIVGTIDELLARRGVATRMPAMECAWSRRPAPRPDEMAAAFADRKDWDWTQLVEVPRMASTAEASAAIDRVRRQARRATPLVYPVVLEEGRSAQLLHVGTDDEEAASVGRLFEGILSASLRPAGRLHEIQLVDAATVPNGRGRCILRVPIASLTPASH